MKTENYRQKEADMKRSVIYVLLTSFLVAGAVFAGQGYRGQGGPGMAYGIGRITNLTQEQKDKIFALEQSLRKDVAAFQVDADNVAYELHKVLTASTIDEKKANDLHAKLQDLRTKIANRRFETHLAIMKLLTPDQRKQLADMPRTRGGSAVGGPKGGVAPRKGGW